MLVSGACTPLLDRVAADFGFEIVLGTGVPTKHGAFDPEARIEYRSGARKVRSVQDTVSGKNVDFGAGFAFADSYSNLPLLELVGNPVAVRPDGRLYRTARERDWRIIGEPKK